MKTQSTIKYKNPPIHEIICGVRFDSIKHLQSGHFGILWQKFKRDFPKTEDQDLIGAISQEDFGNISKLPLPRIWFIHKNENELIQVQRNCFLHNWRKRRADDIYPGYEKVVDNFERYLSLFQDFLVAENLGNLNAIEYELTYIDLIPQGQGWKNFDDLEKVFPTFLSITRQDMLSIDVRSINWQTIYGLPNDLGQLRIAIRTAKRTSDDHHLLHIEFNAHGSKRDQPIRNWFNASHNAIIELFSNFVSNEIQDKFWGKKPC